MKIAVITAITDGMDDFKECPNQLVHEEHELEFFRFTDADVPDMYKHLNGRTRALFFKQQMHHFLPDFDAYLWLDGKIQVLCADFIQQCIDALGDGHLAILKHGERSCVYDEVNHILHQIRHGNKYLKARYGDRGLAAQAKQMSEAGYPRGAGLNDCSVIMVRNTNLIMDIFTHWWAYCQDQKAFDQIYIRFLVWQNRDAQIKDINLKPASFKLVKHLKVQ